jgi:multisubunit Na+/H+ antiporter MnhE subunit
MFVLWLLLVDTVQFDELIVGALAAAIAASVGTAVHRRGYVRFAPRLVWAREVPGILRGVVVDCWLLGGALWRRVVRREDVRGTTMRVAFHYGDDSGRDGARRAAVNFAVSLTPNSYVVDIDPDADSLLVRRLVPAPLDAVLRREHERAVRADRIPGGEVDA